LAKVIIRNPETFEFCLKKFTDMVKKEGILGEIRSRQYYKGPSAKRKDKAIKAKKTKQKAAQKSRR